MGYIVFSIKKGERRKKKGIQWSVVVLTTSSSEGGLTDFSTFLDSFLEQVANNITPSAYKVVDDTTVTVNVMVGPLNHPTRVS